MTKCQPVILGAVLVAVALTAFWLGSRSRGVGSAAPDASVAAKPASDKKVLYWYDPMVPNTHFEKPGKSPFMDMELVPMYDEPKGAQGAVSIDSRTRQNLGIRTAAVTSGAIEQRIESVGYVEADQRKIATVQTRVQGWVERLAVAAVNDSVRKGQVVMEIYSPDLLAAQAEYLLASRDAARPDGQMLAQASRTRLSVLGMTEEQIRQLGVAGRASRRFAYLAPINGVVTELNVRLGAQVSPGANAMSLVDLSSIWVIAEIPETLGAWVRAGISAEIRLAAYPQRKFTGSVEYVYPEVTQTSRSLRARIRLDNRDAVLKPGMYADVVISAAPRGDKLQIPSEAVIATGTRKVAIVVEADGSFRPQAVKTGGETGGMVEVLEGLTLGQRVVTSGQFLLDSESNMRSGLARMEPAENPAEPMATSEIPTTHTTRGQIKAIDLTAGSITVTHEPIPALKWPAMTMDFSVPDKKALEQARTGQKIEFDFSDKGNGSFVVTAIRPMP